MVEDLEDLEDLEQLKVAAETGGLFRHSYTSRRRGAPAPAPAPPRQRVLINTLDGYKHRRSLVFEKTAEKIAFGSALRTIRSGHLRRTLNTR